MRKEGGLADQGGEALAILSSGAITSDDLRAGRYRGAEVTEYVVNWMFPFVGFITTSTYWFIETEYDQDVLTVQIGGLEAKLRAETGTTHGLECRYVFGAAFGKSYAGCKVDPAAYTKFSANVDFPDPTAPRRKFHADTNVFGQIFDETGYFNFGKITWTGGLNSGLVSDVRIHTRIDADDWDIELVDDLPYDISSNDQFHIEAGCNHLSGIANATGHCKNKFGAVEYYGGKPYLAGTDKMGQIPLT